MTHKQLLFKTGAREKLLHGVTEMTNAIRVTLGPKSKCVLIEKKFSHPLVCNDGVTIAKEISFTDPNENLGAQIIREAAEKTGDAVGDGTSTATILAQEIYSAGLHNIAAGASAVDIKKGLERGLKIVIDELHKISRPIVSKKERGQIATIAAHNDAMIGDLIADAMEKVGKDGVITVEEAKGTETILDVVEGLQFDRGYISPYFVTNPDKMQAIYEEPYILLHEKKLSTMKDLVPLLEEVSKNSSSLVIIAEDVDSEALATIVLNKLRGVLHCVAVKAPGFGDRRKAMLEDIAILTGGHLVSEELGTTLENTTIKDLGRAQRVVIDKDTTTLVGGFGMKATIDSYREDLRHQIEKTTSTYDKEKLQERLAKLSGGVAVIRVGAPSEVEMRYKKDALEDAISATKAAIAEGIVPGGGLSLLRSIEALAKEEQKCQGDERTGIIILKQALEAPTRQIAQNSGVDGGVVVDKMIHGTGAYGFDASKNCYVDLIEAGIIDPTKVVRIALENAISVAVILLMTEATLTEIPEEKHGTEPELQQ